VGGGDDFSARVYLQKIEQGYLDKFSKRVGVLIEQLQELAETRFFREDLEPEVKRINDSLAWLDAWNQYLLVVYESDAKPMLMAERYILQLFATYFQEVPTSKELTLQSIGPGRGQIVQHGVLSEKAEKYSWEPDKKSNALKLSCTTHANVPVWTCSLGSELVSEGFGAVLWNRASWVWFHPKIRFVIRYDWFANEQLFRYHRGLKSRKPQAGEVVLPDWRWTGRSLEPVYSEQVEPEQRRFETWLARKQVPAIVVLLVAMLFQIQTTCAKLIPSVAAPKRIHNDQAQAVYYRPNTY